ncbi:10732_t:CDS:2, partial [Funneliformis caledonium]
SFSGIPTRALPNESSASSIPFPPANNVNKGAQYDSDLYAKKKRWEVNDAIQPSQIHDVYFVDPTEESRLLLEKIHRGQFVALHGPKASGKSTRVLHIMNYLHKQNFIRIYVSFEDIKVTESEDIFWSTLGSALQRDTVQHLGTPSNPIIKSASCFLNTFFNSN